jgi:hypothetical protein
MKSKRGVKQYKKGIGDRQENKLLAFVPKQYQIP